MTTSLYAMDLARINGWALFFGPGGSPSESQIVECGGQLAWPSMMEMKRSLRLAGLEISDPGPGGSFYWVQATPSELSRALNSDFEEDS